MPPPHRANKAKQTSGFRIRRKAKRTQVIDYARRTCTNTLHRSSSTTSFPPFFSLLPASTSTSMRVTAPRSSRASKCGSSFRRSTPGLTVSLTRLSLTLTNSLYGLLVRATGTCGVMSRCVCVAGRVTVRDCWVRVGEAVILSSKGLARARLGCV